MGACGRIGGADAVGLGPIIGDAVPAGPGERGPGGEGAVTVVGKARAGLVRVDRSLGSQGRHIPDHEKVHRIPWKGPDGFDDAGITVHLAARGDCHAQRGNGRSGGSPGRGQDGGAAHRIGGRTVEHPVLVAVQVVAHRIGALVGVDLEVVVPGAGGAGTGDEIVAHDVMGEDPARVGRGIGGLVVVDDVVDVLGVGLGQGLAVVRIDPEVAVEGIGADLHMGAELLADGVGNDAVLNREVGDAHRVHAVELPVLERTVVQDDVVPRPHVDGALARVRVLVALPEADIADDDVALPAQGNLGRHQADPTARGRLPLDGEVAADRHRRGQNDVTAHVEHDNAAARTHRVPEGPRSRVIEVGDMVDGPTAATGRGRPEPISSREGRHLRIGQRRLECGDQPGQGQKQCFKGTFQGSNSLRLNVRGTGTCKSPLS